MDTNTTIPSWQQKDICYSENFLPPKTNRNVFKHHGNVDEGAECVCQCVYACNIDVNFPYTDEATQVADSLTVQVDNQIQESVYSCAQLDSRQIQNAFRLEIK